MKKRRMIIISNCGECPFRDDHYERCTKTKKNIMLTGYPLDSCPLERFIENEEIDDLEYELYKLNERHNEGRFCGHENIYYERATFLKNRIDEILKENSK